MLDTATFRQRLPEFTSGTTYPDAVVQLQLDVAYGLLDPERWDALLDVGAMWMAAHFLAIATADQSAASAGAAPGAVKGVQTSKTVGSVSVGMDTGAVTLTDGGFWNSTTYGVRFLQFARMAGAGGVQF